MRPTECPYCGTLLDYCAGHGDVLPESGDRSLCWLCKGLSVFVATPDGLGMRKATRQEVDAAVADPDFRDMVKAFGLADSSHAAERMYQRMRRSRSN